MQNEVEKNIQIIEEFFKVPDRMADKIKNVVEKAKGGYVLIETRPRWDGSPGPWTRHPVVKIIYHKPSDSWRLYWMRSSGKWYFYKTCKYFNKALAEIEEDKHACFWG